MRRNRKEPRTRREWQEAVDGAAGLRVIGDCMMYGLITGPEINVARCDDILSRGAERGVRPSRPDVELALDLIKEINSPYATAPAAPRESIVEAPTKEET